MERIGPNMRAAVEYVAENPGCPKLPVARAIGPHGSTKFGYEAVDRAMRAGLIEHRGGMAGTYSLYVTEKGETLIQR